jgi:hypothetical protein
MGQHWAPIHVFCMCCKRGNTELWDHGLYIFCEGGTLSLEIVACVCVCVCVVKGEHWALTHVFFMFWNRGNTEPWDHGLCVCVVNREILSPEIMASVCVVMGETLSPDSCMVYVLKWENAEPWDHGFCMCCKGTTLNLKSCPVYVLGYAIGCSRSLSQIKKKYNFCTL